LVNRIAAVVCFASLLPVIAAGCQRGDQPLNGGHDRLAAPLGTISVYQLAGRLNLSVAENNGAMATLTGPGNVVVIYSDPNGGVYVNGVAVPDAGQVTTVGDMVFVSDRLGSRLGGFLRKAPETTRLPRIKKSPPRPRRMRIVIDPGHGGKDPGAISLTGAYEKAIVLDTSLAVAGILAGQGMDVILTRQGDSFVELNDRADMANRSGADALVSIHADHCPNSSVKGFTVYVARSASRRSLKLARSIADRLQAAGVPSRGINRAGFRVLYRSVCPAVLVELGYLSNATEASKLARSDYRRKLAAAIGEGVLRYARQNPAR